jgi:uncharacterized membrane protein YfcA
MIETDLLLAVLFFLVATLYSSVGHAGASGYIAAMALLGFAPEQMRPTALALNLLVGGIGLFRFWRRGHVQWRNVVPFIVASVPAAYFAAQVKLPKESYELLLGLILLAAAIGIFRSAGRVDAEDARVASKPIPWLPATGTGGAIFLTPLLLFMHWAKTRDASGISVAFVWINSAAGLIGLWKATGTLPSALPMWLVAAALGAALGTQFGLKWLPLRGLRYSLSVVLLIAAGKLLLA